MFRSLPFSFFSGVVREPLDVKRDNCVFGSRSRATPILIRKCFSYDESAHTDYSVFPWESEAHAQAFFNDEFVSGLKAKFSTVPELFCVDTLMVIDNEAVETTTS